MINRFERIRKEGYSFINLNSLLIGQTEKKLAKNTQTKWNFQNQDYMNSN